MTRLHYEIDGWLGDALVESFPVFLITPAAMAALMALGATGVEVAEAEITASIQFQELHPSQPPPSFLWLKPTGTAGCDDAGLNKDGRLVISRRILDALQPFGIAHALTAPFLDRV
ncbi:hypothetical protein AZA_89517 [Nitrospirillum viridazoti Y2]|uniref:hypothetical protein n=1 Tax=Nitrospirillum viridazoti TaxID=3144925 RepID=UPI0002265A0F|nr:hypothetical protein [Nitrospirillum amazonense]EGY00419.1 hypothetical protein AZA_89517 [Nitrospirillum amazonense Y2]